MSYCLLVLMCRTILSHNCTCLGMKWKIVVGEEWDNSWIKFSTEILQLWYRLMVGSLKCHKTTYQSLAASTSWVWNLQMQLFHIVPQPYLLFWSFMTNLDKIQKCKMPSSLFIYSFVVILCCWLMSNKKHSRYDIIPNGINLWARECSSNNEKPSPIY